MQRMNTVFGSTDTGLALFFHGEFCMDSKKKRTNKMLTLFWLISPPAKLAFPVHSFLKKKIDNFCRPNKILTIFG